MICFKLESRQVRHVLYRRSRDRIGALVCGRKMPTIETEDGRLAELPDGALPWAIKMGLSVFTPVQVQPVAA